MTVNENFCFDKFDDVLNFFLLGKFLVKDLCDEIENYENLIALRLEGNTMSEEAATAIGIAVEKHPELQVGRRFRLKSTILLLFFSFSV